MRFLLLIILLTNYMEFLQTEESAQYLENVMRDLKNMKNHRQSIINLQQKQQQQQQIKLVTTSIVSTTPKPISTTPNPILSTKSLAERRIQYTNNDKLPSLSLTKGELAALYEAAVSKGETIKLDTGNNSYIHAAVHEVDNHEKNYHNQLDEPNSEDISGYYYYYYPLKSFIDEISSQPSSTEFSYSSPIQQETIHTNTYKPYYHQYHSHTHQHNVNITPIKDMMDGKKKDKKALEPLFMAISGFVGMAVMFVLSVLVLPRFGIKKTIKNGKKNERIGDIARIALKAIEGQDCGERFACELEKTARTFNLNDNRFIRLIKRMAPSSFGKQMGKYANKRLRCTAIPCKKKIGQKKKSTAQIKH